MNKELIGKMFKIEISKCKTDRWGHILPSSDMQPLFCETLDEAVKQAVTLSNKYKKNDVSVLDLNGPIEYPEDGLSTIWCVCAYKGGKLICKNRFYYDAQSNKR